MKKSFIKTSVIPFAIMACCLTSCGEKSNAKKAFATFKTDFDLVVSSVHGGRGQCTEVNWVMMYEGKNSKYEIEEDVYTLEIFSVISLLGDVSYCVDYILWWPSAADLYKNTEKSVYDEAYSMVQNGTAKGKTGTFKPSK